MKEDCQKRAKDFSLEYFQKQLSEIVK
jgi:hypothetical protein